jgi:hypothetical protein
VTQLQQEKDRIDRDVLRNLHKLPKGQRIGEDRSFATSPSSRIPAPSTSRGQDLDARHASHGEDERAPPKTQQKAKGGLKRRLLWSSSSGPAPKMRLPIPTRFVWYPVRRSAVSAPAPPGR